VQDSPTQARFERKEWLWTGLMRLEPPISALQWIYSHYETCYDVDPIVKGLMEIIVAFSNRRAATSNP
jgi:hypothetical protein